MNSDHPENAVNAPITPDGRLRRLKVLLEVSRELLRRARGTAGDFPAHNQWICNRNAWLRMHEMLIKQPSLRWSSQQPNVTNTPKTTPQDSQGGEPLRASQTHEEAVQGLETLLQASSELLRAVEPAESGASLWASLRKATLRLIELELDPGAAPTGRAPREPNVQGVRPESTPV